MTTTIDQDSVVSDATSIDDTDSPYTTSGEDTIQVDTSSGAVTVTLASADVSSWREIRVVDTGLNAGTNNITINTEGGETINPGSNSSISIAIDGGYEDLWSDGSNWFSSRQRESKTLSALQTDRAATASRSIGVIVHTDGSTVWADGPAGTLQKGDFSTPSEVHTVIQAAFNEARDRRCKVAFDHSTSASNATPVKLTVNDQLKLYSQSSLVGNGREDSIAIELNTDTPDSIIQLTTQSYNASNIRGIVIQDMRLIGPGKGTAGSVHGIDVETGIQIYGNEVRNCQINGFSGNGINVPDGFSNHYIGLTFQDIGGWMYEGDAGVITTFESWKSNTNNAGSGGIWAKQGRALFSGVNIGDLDDGATAIKLGDGGNSTSIKTIIDECNIESVGGSGAYAIRLEAQSMASINATSMHVDGNIGDGTAVGVYIEQSGKNNINIWKEVRFKNKNAGTWDNELEVNNTDQNGVLLDYRGQQSNVPSMNTTAGNHYVAVTTDIDEFEDGGFGIYTKDGADGGAFYVNDERVAGVPIVSNDGMTADPETATEDGYFEVTKGGTTYQVPIYQS